MSVKKDFVYIFVHIPKTAGTTLVKNITKNLNKGEALELSPKSLGMEDGLSLKEYKKEAIRLVSKQKNLKKVKFVYGHSIPYGIHKYFNKKARYITVIRNPVRRIPSIYNYFYMLSSRHPDKKLRSRLSRVFLSKGKRTSFEKWYKDKFERNSQDMALINTYQFLSSLGYIRKSHRSLASLKRDLQKFYFIGITKNFRSDSLFIYNLLGVKKYFFSENISDKIIQINENSALARKIKSGNPISKKIFDSALSLNQRFISNNSNYWSIVKNEGLRKALLTPITQLIFEPGLILQRLRSKIFP